MTIETISARKRFCKDFGLPIIIFESPYFEYFIDLYDRCYSTYEKYELFQEAYNDNEQEFFAQSKKLIDDIRESVIKSEAWLKLSEDKELDKLINPPKLSQSIYKPENEGKVFISLDLKEANFQALKSYDESLVSNCGEWKELVSKFTDKKYFQKAKMFRQVAFGELQPKKQQKLQFQMVQNCVNQFNQFIKNNSSKQLLQIYSISADEIVFSSQFTKKDIIEKTENNDEDLLWESIHFLKFYEEQNKSQNKFSPWFTIKEFYLEHIAKDWYAQVNIGTDEKTKFKNCPNFFLPQILKRYYKEGLTLNDMLFFHEGKLSQFIEPLFPNEKTINS